MMMVTTAQTKMVSQVKMESLERARARIKTSTLMKKMM